MNGITRYIVKQLLLGLIFTTGALTCVIWLVQSLRFVEMIVNHGLSIMDFLYLTVLLLPNFLTIILPIAFFMVVVFTYGRLMQDRELAIMRSAGLSQMSLAKPAMIVGFSAMVMAYLLNLWLLPTSYAAFLDMKWEMRSSLHMLLREGAFNDVGPNTTIYVRKRESDGQLRGIFLHDESDENKPYSLMAERGGLVRTEDGARVIMFNGNRQEVDKQSNQLSILYFDRYAYDLDSGREPPAERNRGGRERTLPELLDAENDRSVKPDELSRLKMEAHRRIVTPVAILGYGLVALAFLLSGSFTRRMQGKKILGAVIVFVVLNALGLSAESMTTKNPAFAPLMYLVSLLPAPVALWFLNRPPRVAGSTVVTADA